MLRVTDCIGDCVRFRVPQPTEWQRIGKQIEALSRCRNFARMPVKDHCSKNDVPSAAKKVWTSLTRFE
jgi:hypothetical protein